MYTVSKSMFVSFKLSIPFHIEGQQYQYSSSGQNENIGYNPYKQVFLDLKFWQFG